MLWRNAPAIIIGRHQRMEDEVDISKATRDDIALLRRISGGGAVYHDLGNLNFSFLAINHGVGASTLFRRFLAPVCSALRKIDVDAVISGRNDIMAFGRKISGCSLLERKNHVLCHGTLLVATDLERLDSCLLPDKAKLRRHGVASIRSRVANISQYWREGTTFEQLKNILITTCAPAGRFWRPPAEIMEEARSLATKKYSNKEWNIGPKMRLSYERRLRFAFGEIIIRWAIENDHISVIQINGDYVGIADSAKLEDRLAGIAFCRREIAAALANEDMNKFFSGCDPAVIRQFFCECAPV